MAYYNGAQISGVLASLNIESDDVLKGIMEKNKGEVLSIWYGTKEEYDAINEKLENCFYIVKDDTENKTTIADYIVEQGTFNPFYYNYDDPDLAGEKKQSTITWFYRKWNSGIAEIWGVGKVSTAAFNTAHGGGYIGKNTHRYCYPFTLYDATVNATPVYGQAYFDLVVGRLQGSLETCTPTYYPRVATAISNTTEWFHIHYQVIGRWK